MIICVTGKMAAGKNFFCADLKKNGFVCVDADILVHNTIEKLHDKIVDAFGDIARKKNIDILNTDNTINRKNLGKIVFQNKKLLKKQETIVYPEIENLLNDFINENKNKNKNIAINATVLYKIPSILKICEKIVYIRSHFLTRFFRVKKRDNLSTQQILKRFWQQRNLLYEYKKANIQIIKIWNNQKNKTQISNIFEISCCGTK